MLIIQHIWTKWTKASRGANAPLQRPRLAEAYSVPPLQTDGETLLHDIRALERQQFEIVETVQAVTPKTWLSAHPSPVYQEVVLDWKAYAAGATIRVTGPSSYRLQTRRARGAFDTINLSFGETARVDWNGRMRSSLFGSNRSSYYEQHIYWFGFVATFEPDLFLNAQPNMHVDLRTNIY